MFVRDWRFSVIATAVTAVLLDWTLWCIWLRVQFFSLEAYLQQITSKAPPDTQSDGVSHHRGGCQ